jgi:hypothetical protein
MRKPEFRIIACDAQFETYADGEGKFVFYLQRRRWFGWQTQSGYHRGAPGDYAYQYECAMNPYALINRNIPEITAELMVPSLPPMRKQEMFSKRPRRKFLAVGIVDIEAATTQLREYQATNPPVTKFIPPGGIPWAVEVEGI